MNQDILITNMIRRQRARHISAGLGWPGKSVNDPVATRYPNLAAELGWGVSWLHLAAEFADVSQEVMAAVLEDDEELSGVELCRLACCFGWPVDYLVSPKIAIVDPVSGRGEVQRLRLADLMRQAGSLEYFQWRAAAIFDALKRGDPVTYASYRWAVGELKTAIQAQQASQHERRSHRITAV